MPLTIGDLLEGWFKWLLVFARITLLLLPLIVILLVASMLDASLHKVLAEAAQRLLNITRPDNALHASGLVRDAIRYVLAPALVVSSIVALIAGAFWLVRR